METSLTSRGMLVNLAISKWVARAQDKRATDEVTRAHGAEKDAGWFNKMLMPKDALKEVDAACNALRSFHYEQTLPWSDQGYRILPAQNYFAYTNEHRKLVEAFNVAVREFVAKYAAFTEEGRRRLGRLFQASDYPAPAEIGRKFDVNLSVMPLPNGADFRVDLGDEERQRLADAIEARTRAAIEHATRDIWQRLYHGVEHLRDRLKRYEVDENGKVHNPFRDTAVANLRELVELLPRLNMTGDPDLEAMRHRLASTLCVSEAEELRRDDDKRRDTAAEADAILAAMAGYVSEE